MIREITENVTDALYVLRREGVKGVVVMSVEDYKDLIDAIELLRKVSIGYTYSDKLATWKGDIPG